MQRWIFGYGSLVFRPGFPFEEQRPALLEGWMRRFWQGSVDHRGEPGAPGRVVTLLPAPRQRCWGMAFRVADTHWPAVLSGLDVREVGGYERHELPLQLHGSGGRTVTGLTYVATAANQNYLGDAPLREMAAQVVRSRGPSGHNADYLLGLADALRRMGVTDEHVFALEQEVRRQLALRST